MKKSPDLHSSVAAVVLSDNCSGCGACATLAGSISMELDAEGFMRPVFVSDDGPTDRRLTERFAAVCPGVGVTAAGGRGIPEHPTLGPHVSAWLAWAGDPDVRHAGSSGGVLSALSSWLMEAGIATSVVGAAMSGDEPRRTVPLVMRTKAEVLGAAGSRYAPVANAQLFDPSDASRAFVGKPCEAYAARKLIETGPESTDAPILLSFFCAGVPSQAATDELISALDIDQSAVVALRYRGNGWPGDFVVEDANGKRGAKSYEESWGAHLGRRLQQRCKICPDGTGGHADIAVGDYWHSDESGFPRFDDADGISVAIARTQRGHQLLMDAREAGVLVLGAIELDDVAAVQPLQVRRRRTLFGRLVGLAMARRPMPKYRGFGLLKFAAESPRETVQAARGTFSRSRRRQRSGTADQRLRSSAQ